MSTSLFPSPSPSFPDGNVVPGASILGFGFNVATARSSRDVTQRIINIDVQDGTTVVEGGVSYLLPANVSLIDLHTQSLHFGVFATSTEVSEHFASTAEVSTSAWGFSGRFDASYSSLLTDMSASYYGLVEASVELWDLSVENLETLELDSSFQSDLKALGNVFDTQNQSNFYDFFNKWGTHVISTTSVGGFLNYCVAVSSSSHFNKVDAAANMTLEYQAVFEASASASVEWNKMDKSWVSSRNATLLAQGGDDGTLLAQAVPFNDPNNEVDYSALITAWSTSVNTAPGVVSQLLQPLSHVAPTTQVAALDRALESYLNSTISAEVRQTILVDPTPFEPVSNAATVLFGTTSVAPPVPKSASGFEAMYWIIVADDDGNVQYNANKLSDDPDDLDALIVDAQVASDKHAWWTLVISSGTSHQPSDTALNWLQSCGIPTLGWYDGYVGWPNQVVALGKSGSPEFAGQVQSVDGPYYYNYQPDQTASLATPLFVAAGA